MPDQMHKWTARIIRDLHVEELGMVELGGADIHPPRPIWRQRVAET